MVKKTRSREIKQKRPHVSGILFCRKEIALRIPDPPDRPVPPGAVPAGEGYMYPDMQGDLHKTPEEAINANQRFERDYSRGASGGCSQDPFDFPPRGGGW